MRLTFTCVKLLCQLGFLHFASEIVEVSTVANSAGNQKSIKNVMVNFTAVKLCISFHVLYIITDVTTELNALSKL